MTAHPSDMGVQLSLLEQNQASALSIMHPVCSLHSDFCRLVLQNFAGSLGSTGLFVCVLCCRYCAQINRKAAEGDKDKHNCV